MSYRVAVVGATGNVGQEVINILSERAFPIKEIKAVASSYSSGQIVSFGEDETLQVVPVTDFDFSGYDFVFFATSNMVSAEFAPMAAEAGCVVIDCSSQFRQEPEVPLVVPEVNSKDLDCFRKCNIIASPNCVAIPLSLALSPLKDEVNLKRAVVSTYQSVSGAGRAAMDELFGQTRSVYMNQPIAKEEFPKQIAFNVIPQIDAFQPNGTTLEESKIEFETKKILDNQMNIAVTSVRVPVFIGHSMAVAVEFDQALTPGEARALWREKEWISIVDYRQEDGYVTPAEVAGEDNVFISRIRSDKSVEHGLLFWVVSDNLRKGAALNAVQIAEAMIKNCLTNNNIN